MRVKARFKDMLILAPDEHISKWKLKIQSWHTGQNGNYGNKSKWRCAIQNKVESLNNQKQEQYYTMLGKIFLKSTVAKLVY